MQTVTTDYHVINSAGRTVRTFSELDMAKKWTFKNTHLYGDLRVERITQTIERVTVYKPRRKLAKMQAAA